MYFDITNEVHLMLAGGVITVLMFVARMYVKICIDRALKERDTQLKAIEDDLGETNQRIVGYMHQMFAQINELTPRKNND